MTSPIRIEDVLREIESAVGEIRSILLLLHRETIDSEKQRLLPKGKMKTRIYDLCDGTRTSKEIAGFIHKETKYVSAYLTGLRREGLIRTVYRAEREVHEQTM